MDFLKLLVLSLLLAVPASAQGARIDAETAFARSQAAIGNQTGPHLVVDHRGREFSLADLRGRPLVVSLIFTSCATVCPVTTQHLRDAVLTARKTFGEDSFAVLTFGFDAAGDRPAQLAAFAGAQRLTGIPGWTLASADEATIAALLDDVGFSFATVAGGFDHVTQTTILDADGRVFRQIYGDDFPLPMLVEPLKALIFGTSTQSMAPADLWDRLRFLCTIYDPAAGAYRFDYGILFGITFGGLSLLAMAAVILKLWLERQRALRARNRLAATGRVGSRA